MTRRRIGFVSFAAAIIFAATLRGPETAAGQADSAADYALAAKLRMQRTSATDLEVGGDLRGLPAGTTGYLTREDLLAASQAMTISPEDGSFKVPVQVRGVLLEDLALSLGVPASNMVIAICKDKYRGHYSRAYLSAHHPVLVMELDGKLLSGLPETGDRGPYLIAHANFKPAFKVLAHSDEPQIPWGVIRLEFRDERTVFGAIAPQGNHPNESHVEEGYKIARQNCFRCHDAGTEGGEKAHVPWFVLSAIASESPEFFMGYVRDPKSKSPQAQMPGSPEYDQRTLRALTAYFQSFGVQGQL